MSKTSLYSILLIVAWSLLVHIPGITSPLLDTQAYRQCFTASVSRNYVRHGMVFLNPEVDMEGLPTRAGIEFPVYSYLLALLFKAFGVHGILGRLLSCLFGAWGAVYLFRLVRPRLGDPIALWSALVMCSIPIHIYFTRTVQREPMALWGFLGFIFYADCWLNRNGKFGSWMMAFILGSIAALLKIPLLYIMAPLWVFLGYERYGLKALINLSWVGLLALILAAVEAWYGFAKTAPVALIPLTLQEHLANLAPILTRRLWEAQFVSRVPELVMTYSGLLFAGIGVYSLRKEKSFAFFMVWLGSSALHLVLLGEYGLIHRYTLLPLAPAAAIWIACGIVTAQVYTKKRWLLGGLVGVLIIGIPVHAALRIKEWYRVEYPYLTEARQILAKVSRPEDLVLVVTHEVAVPLYYVDRYGYGMEPGNWQPADLDAMIRRGVRFVLIPIEDNAKRLPDLFAAMASRGTRLKTSPGYCLYRIEGSTSRVARQL